MATSGIAALDGLVFADSIGAAAVLWHQPIVQSHADYLYDEHHLRDWLRRRIADQNDDGRVSPEEWGYYQGKGYEHEKLFLSDVDLDGDGYYTQADSELAGAEPHAQMLAIVASESEVAWRAFWGDDDERFPSVAWALEGWEAPDLEALLAGGSAPVFVLHGDPVLAPRVYLDPLIAPDGPARIRPGGTASGHAGVGPYWRCLDQFVTGDTDGVRHHCAP